MVYKNGKRFLRFVLMRFFRTITVSGAPLVEDGPLLIVANHPNFALDGILISTTFKRDLFFLAKSTIFRGKLMTKFLESAHLIPVYRKQDNPQETTKNTETFRAAVDHMSKGEGIVIFPEGISLGERRLQDLKTGAARLAFQAEDGRDFGLGLKIQPVGLTYTDIDEYQSSVTLVFGTPIDVSSYREAYERDAVNAVRQLMGEIEERLKECSVHLEKLEHADLIEKVGKVYQSRGSELNDFERLAEITRHVTRLGPRLPEKRAYIERRIDEYLGMIELFGGGAVASEIKEKSSSVAPALIIPVVVGFLTNFIPFRIIGKLVRRFSTHPVDRASYKLGFGILVFALWYIFVFISLLLICEQGSTALLVFLLLILSSYAQNRHGDEARIYLLSRLWPGRLKPIDLLKVMRNDLIEELETLRNLPTSP